MAITVWKVLGGAAAGVATIVALPIAGPIGVVTAMGALAAGSVGAAAGALAGSIDDSEERAEKRGEARAKAESDRRTQKFVEALKKAEEKINSAQEYHNLLIAMTALAMSCANCDGEIHNEEQLEIMEFITGVGGSGLPVDVQERLNKLAYNPPSLTDACVLIKKLPNIGSYDVFDDIVDLTIHADGIVHQNEIEFLREWNNVKMLLS